MNLFVWYSRKLLTDFESALKWNIWIKFSLHLSSLHTETGDMSPASSRGSSRRRVSIETRPPPSTRLCRRVSAGSVCRKLYMSLIQKHSVHIGTCSRDGRSRSVLITRVYHYLNFTAKYALVFTYWRAFFPMRVQRCANAGCFSHPRFEIIGLPYYVQMNARFRRVEMCLN